MMKINENRMSRLLLSVIMAIAFMACKSKSVEKFSFIDAATQQFAETALGNRMDSVEASAGAVAVMEVSTGKILAWVEIAHGDSITKDDAHLLTRNMEPGSLFYSVSLMIALDDGKVKPSDTINTGGGIWEIDGNYIRDRNADKGGYGAIRAEQVVPLSSRVGMSKIIHQAYEYVPEAFLTKVKEIDWENSASGTNENLSVDSSSMLNGKSFVWASIGYGIYLKPIALLGFYNAIANGGCMVQSRRIGVVDSPVRLRNGMCSKATLKVLQNCLENSVLNGTGRMVQSKDVRIAGACGLTEDPYGYKRRSSNTVSFCGYFPAEKPKYTCMVVLRDPKKGRPSGGQMAGVVLKEIAEWLNKK